MPQDANGILLRVKLNLLSYQGVNVFTRTGITGILWHGDCVRDYKPKYLPHYKPYNEPPVEWALGRKNAESKGFWYDRPSVFNEVMTVQKNADGKIGPTLE